MAQTRTGLIARLALFAAFLVLLRHLAFKLGWRPHPLDTKMLPVVGLWLAFAAYWTVAGKNSAPTETSEPRASTYFHQGLLAVSIYLAVAPLPWLTRSFLPLNSRYTTVIGIVLQAAFLLLAVWARRHLGRNWSAEVRIAVNHQLVRTGPYRYLRHPIYTAMLGMVLGSAIVMDQYHALLGLALLVLAYLRKTSMEEKVLLQTFGPEYETYKRGTWALAPFLF